MQFTAINTRSRDIEISDNSGRLVASLVYPKWFSQRAEITLAKGNVVSLAPVSTFSRTIQALNGTELLYEITTRLWGRIEIGGQGYKYRFKRTSIWRNEYTLLTPSEQVAMVINASFSFKRFRYSYELATMDNYPEVKDPVLLCIALYCLYMVRMRSAAAAT